MSWWKNILGGGEEEHVDYYEEGLALLSAGTFHEALTSFRLALKNAPGDPVILQQIAIAYTRIGMTEEAAKTYRHVLQRNPDSPGAHYGLGFLLLRSGMPEEADAHLESFLANAPTLPEAQRHVAHAREALVRIRNGEVDESTDDDADDIEIPTQDGFF